MGSQTPKGDVTRRRTFWFGAGAVTMVAATLLGLQAWQVGATPPGDDDSTFVPISPCRVVDQRDTLAPNGMGPGQTVTQQITGSNGECSGIPSNAVAVAMNVTIARPTAGSFLTVFPANLTSPPNASNLNWTATSSPTPNKVDVKLSSGGAVKFYNEAGRVFVIADIVGYYTNESLKRLTTHGTANFSSTTSTMTLQGVRAPDGVSLSISRADVGDYTLTMTGLSEEFTGVTMVTPFGDEASTDARVCALGTPNPSPTTYSIDVFCFGPDNADPNDDGDPADASFQFLFNG